MDLYLQSKFLVGLFTKAFDHFSVDTQAEHTPRDSIVVTDGVLFRL